VATLQLPTGHPDAKGTGSELAEYDHFSRLTGPSDLVTKDGLTVVDAALGELGDDGCLEKESNAGNPYLTSAVLAVLFFFCSS